MVRLYTAARVRQADRLSAQVGVPSLLLMENAGRAVAEVAERLRAGSGRPVVVLAGRGNNGGDGLVAARLLAERGLPVEIVLVGGDGGREAFTGDARVNLERLETGGRARCRTFRPGATESGESCTGGLLGRAALADLLAGAGVVIDALLGTGAKGPPREPVAAAIACLNEATAAGSGPDRPHRPAVVAVDLPSGLDADTGRPSEPCVVAGATVTLGAVKVGLASPEAAPFVGRLYLADIGLPPESLGSPPGGASGGSPLSEPTYHWLLPPEAATWLPPRPLTGHKGTFGHVWIVAGSPGFTGAAVLAALGALRAGAGLVTVATPAGCRALVAAPLPEALTVGLGEGADGRLSPAAAADLLGTLEATKARSALVVGPGLGAGDGVAAVVGRLLACPQRVGIVLDADALNSLALGGPDGTTRALRSGAGRVVVTPHPGEMARLTGRPVDEIQADRPGMALAAARVWGVVVALKGAGTVVASPDGAAWVNATGNPGLATGGSGDVVAGAIGAYLAQGLAPLEAALVGVSVHGLAGDLAARDIGSRGLLASDVAHRLPRAADALAAATSYGPEPVGASAGVAGP